MDTVMKESEVRLRDQWGAAYMLAIGCRLKRVVQEEGSKHLNYVFDDDSGQASTAFEAWRAGTSLVLTKRFIQAYKAIKQISWCQASYTQKNEDMTHGESSRTV